MLGLEWGLALGLRLGSAKVEVLTFYSGIEHMMSCLYDDVYVVKMSNTFCGIFKKVLKWSFETILFFIALEWILAPTIF